jgi:hypothetical protein
MTTSDPRERLGAYASAFAGKRRPAQPIEGIHGRLCRRRPDDPVRLSDHLERRIVFLVDHRVCHEMIGRGGWQIVTSVLGWNEDYARRKVRSGLRFDLVAFLESACRLGAWDAVIDLAVEMYPEVAAKIARHREALRGMTPESLRDLERRRGCTFLEVDERGEDDPRFVTIARYHDGPDTADAARAFFYHVVHCKEYFTGTGLTLVAEGATGVPEYVMPDRPLAALGEHVVIPIDIEIPVG